MLIELRVADLGVIEELAVTFGSSMTAVTGETGAGKTLIVGAIELLVGGRADPSVVRPGATEAVIDGRFDLDGEEVVLTRVVPASGRSRAYVDGRPVTASTLASLGASLVDLHGQHDHQSLLAPSVQREALDTFGSVAVEELRAARKRVAELTARIDELGGDERARAHELDLARFQLAELEAAEVDDPDEDDRLMAEEELLGDALGLRETAASVLELLGGEDGPVDRLARAGSLLEGRDAFAAHRERVVGISAELDDLWRDLRDSADTIEDDPGRLAGLQDRRRLLTELRRKYGDTLAEVMTFHREVANRVAELEGHDALAAELEAERAHASAELDEVAERVARARRKAAPKLAEAVEARLGDLAMERARLEVAVEGEAGDDVTFRLAANPGTPLQPLAKVASGGELARAMLALRLVLTTAPPTLVFDEVDAGIGGTAATAVGEALARLGESAQVLVVTHLPQVAAAAHHQVQVRKEVTGESTRTTVEVLDPEARVVELSRMLSGSHDSEAARRHAAELLEATTARSTSP